MRGRRFIYDEKLGEVVEITDAPAKKLKKYKSYTRGQPSLSCGVHTSQIQANIEYNKKMGCPTDYNSKGQPIITSARHQRDFARARGLVNQDGIFS